MLYPHLGWLIQQASAILPEPAVEIVIFQAANAVFGALGLACFYLFLRTARLQRLPSTLGTVLLALSNAYLLHATDMTEPMSSVPPMLLGLVVLRARPHRRWTRWAGGALVGFAATLYLSALGALAPAAILVFAALVPSFSGSNLKRLLEAGLGTAEVVASSLVVFLSALIAASALSFPDLPMTAAAGAMLHEPGGGLFGSFDPRHLAGGVFGFANAFAPLQEWGGASRLFAASPATVAYNLSITTLALLFACALGMVLWACRFEVRRQGRSGDVWAATGWVLGVYLFASYWSATYEKFWLSGSIALGVLTGVALQVSEVSPKRDEETLRGWAKRVLVGSLAILLALSLAMGGLPRRLRANYDWLASREMATAVRPEDLIVYPGWDAVREYMQNAMRVSGIHISLVRAAQDTDFSPEALAAILDSLVSEARQRGGRVLFVEILSMSSAEWAPFFGNRLRLPYEMLEEYRTQATVWRQFSRGPRAPLVVHEF